MKTIKTLTLFASISTLTLLGGCAMVATPTTGVLYTSVKFPGAVTEQASARKQGVGCASSILGLISTGDASIDSAKASAGISKVASVDYDGTSVLGLYARFCTIVKGE